MAIDIEELKKQGLTNLAELLESKGETPDAADEAADEAAADVADDIVEGETPDETEYVDEGSVDDTFTAVQVAEMLDSDKAINEEISEEELNHNKKIYIEYSKIRINEQPESIVESDDADKISKNWDGMHGAAKEFYASHPNATKEHIDKALADKDHMVRIAAAENPNATKEHIAKAMKDKVAVVRAVAVKHPNATKEHIDYALDNESQYARANAAQNPNATKKHLDKALADKDPEVRSSASRHPNLTKEQLHKALDDKGVFGASFGASRHPKLEKEHIDKVLNHSDWQIRQGGAAHPNATKEHIDKALSDNHEEVRKSAVGNPNATKEHIDIALNDKSSAVRALAARHPNATKKHIDKALNDNAAAVRSAATKNPNATKEQLDKALNDTSSAVRSQASKHPKMKNKLKESFEELFEGVPSDIQDKLHVTFVANVNERVEEIVIEKLKTIEAQVADALAEQEKDQETSINTYLTYVAEKWLEENKQAIESTAQVKLTQSFMIGLRELFESHNIEIPEGKVDIVEQLETELAESKCVIESLQAQFKSLKEHLDLTEKTQIVDAACVGLVETESEKFRTLAEEFFSEDVESFARKVNAIKEYFNVEATPEIKPVVESANEVDVPEDKSLDESADTSNTKVVSPRMKSYLAAIRKGNRA